MSASVFVHLQKAGMLVVAGISLTGCTLASDWSDFRIDADALVDGRPVHGSTLWRTRSRQVFPTGARLEVSGVALVIPIAPGRYVYGLFRGIEGGTTYPWDVFVTGMTAFSNAEERLRGNKDFDRSNYSETFDRVAKRLRGRRVPVCLDSEDRLAGQERCLVFVYVGDADDPKSVRMVRPGMPANLDGNTFVIKTVAVGFQKPGSRSTRSTPEISKGR